MMNYLPLFILIVIIIVIAIVKDYQREKDTKALKDYYKHSDEIMQEYEDKKWDKLIESNAQRLFNNWKVNYELPGEEWRKPILMWYIEGMTAYRVSDMLKAKYWNSDINELVKKRYEELQKEYLDNNKIPLNCQLISQNGNEYVIKDASGNIKTFTDFNK